MEEIKGQEFERYKKVYRLNKVTNELEELDEKIDIQEMVNSDRPNCLDDILEKFIPYLEKSVDLPPMVDGVADVNEIDDTLDVLQAYNGKLQEVKQRYGLDEFMSNAEVVEFMKNKRNEVNDYIKNKTEVKNNVTQDNKVNDEVLKRE